MENVFCNDLVKAVVKKFYPQACKFYNSLEMPCAPRWNSHVLKFDKLDTNFEHALFVVLEPKGMDCLSVQFFALGKAITKTKDFKDAQEAIQYIEDTISGFNLVN